MIVSPSIVDGAMLWWSATELAELSTAESGFVGFLTAAVGGWLVRGEERGGGWGCTVEVAAALGLEFFSPAPDGVVD